MSDSLEASMMKRIGELKAENARLKAECQARQAENSVLAVECDSLKAEVERLTIERNGFEQAMNGNITLLKMKRAQVERLTKAGDELAKIRAHEVSLDECVSFSDAYRLDYLTSAWFAAKKGGQP